MVLRCFGSTCPSNAERMVHVMSLVILYSMQTDMLDSQATPYQCTEPP